MQFLCGMKFLPSPGLSQRLSQCEVVFMVNEIYSLIYFFLSSRLQWLSVTPACMIQSKTAIQFPSFFSGKRHLTVNMSLSLSQQIAVIYWFDTSILHSPGRLGSRCREVETDSAHKTSIRWQIWHPSGEDSDKLTNHYTISVMGSHLLLQ